LGPAEARSLRDACGAPSPRLKCGFATALRRTPRLQIPLPHPRLCQKPSILICAPAEIRMVVGEGIGSRRGEIAARRLRRPISAPEMWLRHGAPSNPKASNPSPASSALPKAVYPDLRPSGNQDGGRRGIRTPERVTRMDLQSTSFSHLDILPANEPNFQYLETEENGKRAGGASRFFCKKRQGRAGG
jgi:hypothetical protein